MKKHRRPLLGKIAKAHGKARKVYAAESGEPNRIAEIHASPEFIEAYRAECNDPAYDDVHWRQNIAIFHIMVPDPSIPPDKIAFVFERTSV
jgi:hypothetical protein